MKKGIHPKYNTDAKVKCACGAVFEVGSTEETIQVEICSQCHPFYTGKSKLVDSAGRVDKFKARMQAAEDFKKKTDKKKPDKASEEKGEDEKGKDSSGKEKKSAKKTKKTKK